MLSSGGPFRGEKSLQYDEFLNAVTDGRVQKITIATAENVATGEFFAAGRSATEPLRFTVNVNAETMRELEALLKEHNVGFEYQNPGFLARFFPVLLTLVFIGLLIYLLVFRQMKGMGGGGVFSFGKSRAVRASRDKSKTTFDDVAGIDEAREEVKEIIDFLRSPEKFQRLGGRLPRGCLLVGSPGNGKTLLRKRSPERRTCRFSRSADRISSRCSWAWGRAACATCSSRRSRTPPASSSSMKSTPSAAAARTTSPVPVSKRPRP